MPSCNCCGANLPNYAELAKHILKYRSTHQKGLKWAANFNMKVRQLDRKVSWDKMRENRAAANMDDGEHHTTKADIARELSGDTVMVKTICPNKKCMRHGMEALPVEFVRSPVAWKAGNSYVKLCQSCGV